MSLKNVLGLGFAEAKGAGISFSLFPSDRKASAMPQQPPPEPIAPPAPAPAQASVPEPAPRPPRRHVRFGQSTEQATVAPASATPPQRMRRDLLSIGGQITLIIADSHKDPETIAADLGMDPVKLYAIMAGREDVTLATLAALAGHLGARLSVSLVRDQPLALPPPG